MKTLLKIWVSLYRYLTLRFLKRGIEIHDKKTPEHNMNLLIIAPVGTDGFNNKIRDHVEPDLSEGTSLTVMNLPSDKATPCIESRMDLAFNAVAVMQLIDQQKDNFDGIFVTDMDMSGVEQSRQLAGLHIPVIGGFRASAYTAMMLAQRFSILTIQDVSDLQNEHVRAFGITQNLASIEVLSLGVYDLSNKDKVAAELFAHACKAIDEHSAEAFIFGCTGFIDFADNLSTALSEKFKRYIPVIDPNRTAIQYLQLPARSQPHQRGLSYPPKNFPIPASLKER